jgi:hypothetical protein
MPLPIALGQSDFLSLRVAGDLYVDKTQFVSDLLRDRSPVLLFPRPRRFGKTLNLSTLCYFVERYFVERPGGAAASPADVRSAFSGLGIESAGQDVWRHFQQHPVVFLTFKDLKGAAWSQGRALADIIATEAIRLAPVVEPVLGHEDREAWRLLTSRSPDAGSKEHALRHLTRWLHQATGEKAFILIDEYDTPLHDAFLDEKRYDEVVGFFRNFLSAGLKDNPHLEKGVLTGILRVAEESMFSGLNNLEVYSLLNHAYATSFGFTESEVEHLCAAGNVSSAKREEVRAWYNGYRFGGQVIYNPWSVLSFLGDVEPRARPYWVNTGGDSLIRKLMIDSGLGLQEEVETLLKGGSIVKPVDEHTVFRELETSSDAVFSFLVMSGYLRADELVRTDDRGREHWRLSFPNKEVSTVYRRLFIEWLERGLGGENRQRAFCRALLAGDAAAVEEHLGTLLERTLSYHDTAMSPLGPPRGTKGRAPEVVYQAFVAGLLVALESTHHVRSNRETGLGRCDVLITPRRAGEPGVALELKVLKASETMDDALAAALEQVRAKKYAVELRAAGAQPVVEMAVVFDRKSVRVGRGPAG